MTPVIDLIVEEIEEPSYLEKVRLYLTTLVNELGEANWEMSLTLTSNSYIASLNEEYRGKEGPTDVLTFVMDEGDDGFPLDPSLPHGVGDIVVSLEKVKENSSNMEISYEEELKRVILHGILHLKGMTHEGYDWNEGMLKEQEELLIKYKDIRLMEDNETFLD
ncbi:MAG: rRNA maturation RNase YbeY [Spirochaetales bacterium]|nr:rRNA maturation RNase YbeY [Spirochaetales bacterium]